MSVVIVIPMPGAAAALFPAAARGFQSGQP
jgi:hypothetical protein